MSTFGTTTTTTTTTNGKTATTTTTTTTMDHPTTELLDRMDVDGTWTSQVRVLLRDG